MLRTLLKISSTVLILSGLALVIALIIELTSFCWTLYSAIDIEDTFACFFKLMG